MVGLACPAAQDTGGCPTSTVSIMFHVFKASHDLWITRVTRHAQSPRVLEADLASVYRHPAFGQQYIQLPFLPSTVGSMFLKVYALRCEVHTSLHLKGQITSRHSFEAPFPLSYVSPLEACGSHLELYTSCASCILIYFSLNCFLISIDFNMLNPFFI